MSVRIATNDKRSIKNRVEGMFEVVAQALPFPLPLPLSRDDVKPLALNYELVEQADEVCKTFDIRKTTVLDVFVRTGQNEMVNGKEFNVAYELTLPLATYIYELGSLAKNSKSKWFECQPWHPQYMDVLRYVEDRKALRKEIAQATGYMTRLFESATSWGQALRVLPSLKYVMSDYEQRNLIKIQTRMSRLPKDFSADYELRELTGKLIMKNVMIKAAGTPTFIIGMSSRKIPVTV